MAAKTLIFILSEDEIYIGNSDGDSAQMICREDFVKKTDFHYKEQLQNVLEKYHINSDDYEEYLLAWYSPISTLVPTDIMENSTPEQILDYNFSKDKSQYEVDYNRIPEFSMVNIYDIPLWVKSFFVLRFPRIVMLHLGTGVIKGISNANRFKNEFHIFPFQQFALTVYTQRNEIQLYNNFEYTNESDLVYHIFNIIKQTNSEEKKGKIYFYGERIEVKKFKNDWEQLKIKQNFEVDEQPLQILKYLASCV